MCSGREEPCIWVVVLNYNRKDLTEACLESLARSKWPKLRVVVVDNGSSDDSADYLRERFPFVEMLVNERNLGFGGGNNVGLRYAMMQGAELLWVLNNDTEIAPDCVLELARASMEHAEHDLFAPKIYYHDHPDMLWYAGGEIRLDRPLGVTQFGIGAVDGELFSRIREISFVTGCAFLVRARALARIGLLDEGMFAYSDDVDWSIRAQKAGFRSLFVPSAKLWHKVSGTTLSGQSGQRTKTYLFARNRFIVQKRYSSLLGLLGLIPKYLLSSVARRAYRALVSGEPDQAIALAQGILDGIGDRPRRYPPNDVESSTSGQVTILEES